jgi:hypothetical protein
MTSRQLIDDVVNSRTSRNRANFFFDLELSYAKDRALLNGILLEIFLWLPNIHLSFLAMLSSTGTMNAFKLWFQFV